MLRSQFDRARSLMSLSAVMSLDETKCLDRAVMLYIPYNM